MSDDAEPEEIIQTLPLDRWHHAQGARMVPFAGYSMPIQYEGIIAEHLWARESAGLFDVSHMGQLLIRGEHGTDGVDTALEALMPGDFTGLGVDRMRYSLLLDDEGGILDDLMVTRRTGDFYLVVNGATKADDIAHLHEYLPEELILNHLDDQALLALQGPKAVDALARICPGVDMLVFMTAGAFEIAGVPVWVSRSGYTGEDGFEISLPAADAEQVAALIAAQPEVRPIGLGARDSLRLEAGLPLYGHDLDTTTDAAEAGLGFAVPKRRRAEGGFPGATRTVRHFNEGASRKRIGLILAGRLPAREGAAIFDGDDQVGTVTSGGFSPSLQVPIAMGYVAAASATLNRPLQIEVRGKRLDATVAPMPFVPHRYVRQGS
ncbi:glycine cleavage system aminomethyltransferase GcvT [Rhizorhabdus dicambivorans]|uniref:aminomethyltransferase n=1 Tax=Rhizorhabdus dicambivorans TaxID=1850238 RepID=A0A2A4FVF8_9SPHN|nr:glycine cleavage system aminomethyltransferase GcvT [Rhizorhabdus dicambivorans]ATE63507.1 glycine cleavage system aminomethyltransferase T [Rhizorhabdus dicambivorans]PCE41438.1 glycine cleavage system aminomethyltransferase T [Rhizorhabdus dicambivorans]